MNNIYIHPTRKCSSSLDENGNLLFEGTNDICKNIDGCLDFASIDNISLDRIYYDKEYKDTENVALKKINFEELKCARKENSAYDLLFKSTGNINNKKILLIGNGTSLKELLFLNNGAQIVYTDISIQAVIKVKTIYDKSIIDKGNHDIVFQAVNALHLPYADNTFDVIYGCAFVHHLPNLNPFLSEVYRCLKKGGQCIFLDNAYSKWWQFSKSTFLKPLQIFSQWRTGISPEDKLATKKGGYKKEELENIFAKIGLHSIIFYRVSFLEHLFRRGSIKLIHHKFSKMFSKLGTFLDNYFLRKEFLNNNGLDLVWGGKK